MEHFLSRKILYFTAGFSLLIGSLIATNALMICAYAAVIFLSVTSTLMLRYVWIERLFEMRQTQTHYRLPIGLRSANLEGKKVQ